MDQNLPPDSQTPETHSPRSGPGPVGRAERKRWSPLAVVLGLSALFFAIFLIVSGVVFMSHGRIGKSGMRMGTSELFGEGGSVGVIELKGVIMSSKKVLRRLKAFERDDDIKAVVLRVDSPGGAVAPSQEIYEEVKNYKKPIIASMGSVAASGAFYVSCGARKIFADPGTITGSIGVIMEFLDLQKLYEWARIQRYSIKTGKFKDIGAEYRPMSPEEKALLQNMVDNVLMQFKQAVATGRKLTLAQVTQIADGRIFSGDQAKKEKLVDELGSLSDAIQEAGKMGGIKGKPHVVYPSHPRHGLLEYLLRQGDSGEGDDSQSDSTYRGGLVGSLLRLVDGISGKSPLGSPGLDDIGLVSPGIYWLWTGH